MQALMKVAIDLNIMKKKLRKMVPQSSAARMRGGIEKSRAASSARELVKKSPGTIHSIYAGKAEPGMAKKYLRGVRAAKAGY